ncbi:MAG TPA: helix-turn-helix domain-containing protein [Acidimicrobiales bacterium]
MSDASPDAARSPRLAVLKALGDNTRYAIYLELARSSRPLATAEIAETLDLHPNTVRPHLERMREVGLLDVETEARGAVGRPQHRYFLAADAPSLGLEPPTFPVLARMLLRLAEAARVGSEDAVEAGREQGLTDAETADLTAVDDAEACLAGLVARLDALGFDPTVLHEEASATVGFAHCPFRDLAESEPDLICGLHRGMVEGLVDAAGGATVTTFHNLLDRTPCQVSLAMAAG